MAKASPRKKGRTIQKDIEAIIAQEIVRFTKALPNKEMHFQGEVELDFNEA